MTLGHCGRADRQCAGPSFGALFLSVTLKRVAAVAMPRSPTAVVEKEFHVKHWLLALSMVSFLTGCALSVQPQSAQPPASQQSMAGNHLRPIAVSVSGSDVDLPAFLYRPASPGTHPAMLHLDGCGGFLNVAGLPNESYRFWAEHWVWL